MHTLWLYRAASRLRWLTYRGKIMLIAFLGTHVPLLALIAWFLHRTDADIETTLGVLSTALLATFAGTSVTLFLLDHLLRPVLLTSKALRTYRTERLVPELPREFEDEAGTLMADASETLVELDEALDELSYQDQVTSLLNRAGLSRLLERRLVGDGRLALCAVRLRNYERLGSVFGKDAANAVLREFSERLVDSLPSDMPLARIEAGTFCALADVDEADELSAMIERLLVSLSTDIRQADITVVPEFGAGAALWPDDAEDGEALINNAVSALNEKSSKGGPRLAFFSANARESAKERFIIEQDLRRALKRDEFVLHFQPVVDLDIGQTVGAEALIRWQHPERGLLFPGAFVPVAEASGLIEPMGLWVLRKACEQLKEWTATGFEGRVAVNLSAHQFLDPNLIEIVLAALNENGVAPRRLEIELTETEAMRDHERTGAVFTRLRDMGVSVAIDDFGTGYSSMSYLKSLPFDKLKIDREFVSHVHRSRDSQAICAAMVALAKGLGIKVLAEGTETRDEVKALHEMGCNLFQGYYFAKPLDSTAFLEKVSSLQLTSEMMAARDSDAGGEGNADSGGEKPGGTGTKAA